MAKKKIDWDSIRNDYINGTEVDGKRIYPSTTDLSKKYNIDRGQLGRKSSKEGWLEKRQILVNKISTRCQQKTIEQVSNKGVDFDLKCFNDSEGIRTKLIEQFNKTDKPQELAILVKALKDNQSYAKEALGESPSDMAQELKITIVKDSDD